MKKDFSHIPTLELQKMWEDTRTELAKMGGGEDCTEIMGQLYIMRKELDKRKDLPLPPVSVDFANKYLTK